MRLWPKDIFRTPPHQPFPYWRKPQGAATGGRQKEFDHFVSILVTFWSPFLTLLSLFSSLFCQTPFAGLLLRQGENRFARHFHMVPAISRRPKICQKLHFQNQRAPRPHQLKDGPLKNHPKLASDFCETRPLEQTAPLQKEVAKVTPQGFHALPLSKSPCVCATCASLDPTHNTSRCTPPKLGGPS